MSKFKSDAFVRQASDDVSPGYLRTYDVEVRPERTSDIVAVAASGISISRDTGRNWARIMSPELARLMAGKNLSSFRSAVWLPDGAIEVSGNAGTYRLVLF